MLYRAKNGLNLSNPDGSETRIEPGDTFVSDLLSQEAAEALLAQGDIEDAATKAPDFSEQSPPTATAAPDHVLAALDQLAINKDNGA